MEGDVVGRSGETLEEEEEVVLRPWSGSTSLLMVAVVDCLSRWLSYEDELLVGNLILGIMFVVVGAVEEICCGRSGPVLPWFLCTSSSKLFSVALLTAEPLGIIT